MSTTKFVTYSSRREDPLSVQLFPTHVLQRPAKDLSLFHDITRPVVTADHQLARLLVDLGQRVKVGLLQLESL